jgi:glutaconyl-CoA decarboxylase
MKKQLRITIGKKSYEVTVEDLTPSAGARPSSGAPSAPAPAAAPAPTAVRSARPTLPVEAGAVTSPMAGVVKSILVGQGDEVQKGQPLVILEAMKMENQITAPVEGTVKSLDVGAGDQVQEGHVLLVLE